MLNRIEKSATLLTFLRTSRCSSSGRPGSLQHHDCSRPAKTPSSGRGRDAALLVVGLSDRWSEVGLGAARLELARSARPPTLLVRRGVRPGGIAPPDRFTRYTWILADGQESGITTRR